LAAAPLGCRLAAVAAAWLPLGCGLAAARLPLGCRSAAAWLHRRCLAAACLQARHRASPTSARSLSLSHAWLRLGCGPADRWRPGACCLSLSRQHLSHAWLRLGCGPADRWRVGAYVSRRLAAARCLALCALLTSGRSLSPRSATSRTPLSLPALPSPSLLSLSRRSAPSLTPLSLSPLCHLPHSSLSPRSAISLTPLSLPALPPPSLISLAALPSPSLLSLSPLCHLC
jgi:hypothetical protein